MTSSSAALFKDRDAFLKRQADEQALRMSNDKRQKVDKPSSQKATRPKSSLARSKTTSDFSTDYHASSGGSKTRFLSLATVVEKLQERFLSGQTDSLTLDEIIEEFGLKIDSSDRHWLASEALLDNDKIDVKKENDVNKFVYKPPLDLKAPKKNHLLNLLKSRHEKCEGAITVEDVRDTIPRSKADFIIESLVKSRDVVKFPSNKKEVLFYTDRAYDLQVNSEFLESWKRTSVDGLDERKICEFLTKHGHFGLAKNTERPVQQSNKRRGGRRPDTMKHNQHVADQLEDYSNSTNKK